MEFGKNSQSNMKIRRKKFLRLGHVVSTPRKTLRYLDNNRAVIEHLLTNQNGSSDFYNN
jgi:hypothetical protein